jgi:GTP-binding protein HflX
VSAAFLIDRTRRERILAVGVAFDWTPVTRVEDELDELVALVDTAGADVVGRVVQRRSRPDPATYVGRGKAEELTGLCEALDVDTVVVDGELSPAQQRNLESLLGRTAIDRTAVILDIFAQHATSAEGKLQVELALLSYRLPRLRGRGKQLSQQAGGIGTRGPGETKLEEDRRRIERRILRLRQELGRHHAARRIQRRRRARTGVAQVSLVGYTNAGKSTIMNLLAGAGVPTADQLFTTVDPRTRRVALPGGPEVVLTDTVGFVRKLPHQLVEAYRSTLEVVAESDLLVHVVDGSRADGDAHVDAVRAVLDEIGAAAVPEIMALNKSDLGLAPWAKEALRVGALSVSAATGAGREALVSAIRDALRPGVLAGTAGAMLNGR